MVQLNESVAWYAVMVYKVPQVIFMVNLRLQTPWGQGFISEPTSVMELHTEHPLSARPRMNECMYASWPAAIQALYSWKTLAHLIMKM